jgi:tripartite-type tricarboxylate transporter receptor subunit TctC
VPRAIVEKLAAEFGAIVRSPEVAARFEADGAVPVGSTPQQFAAFLKNEAAKWAKVIREANIQLEQ